MDSRSSFCALSPLVLQGMPVGLHPPPQGLSVDLLNAVPYSVPDGLRRESGTVVIKGMQNCIIRERQRHEERQMVFNARRYAEGLQSTVRVRQLVGQVSGKEHMFVQAGKEACSRHEQLSETGRGAVQGDNL
eukprot:1158541-Pelagomonas_calceolata.AAC.2